MKESIHDQAENYGIKRPELIEQQRLVGNIALTSLTEESEQAWSDYLRAILLARIAMQ